MVLSQGMPRPPSGPCALSRQVDARHLEGNLLAAGGGDRKDAVQLPAVFLRQGQGDQGQAPVLPLQGAAQGQGRPLGGEEI